MTAVIAKTSLAIVEFAPTMIGNEERMGRNHHGHWVGTGHSNCQIHDWFGGHHPVNQGFFVFGTRGDDVLEGTARSNAVIGLKGNDEITGGGGNDWLYGGNGNDLLDGNAGSDKVFGGMGDDTAVYSLAENAGSDACGTDTRDYYDGGVGHDVLRLILTAEELASETVQADIDAFRAYLADQGGGYGGHGGWFKFASFDLTVRNFEALEIVGGNTRPVANPDAYTVTEDTLLVVAADQGVLANDTDADGDDLSAVVVTGPLHGTLVFNDTDGSFSYMPDKDYNGPDSFRYLASDSADEAETAVEVRLTVLEKNDPPVAGKDSATVEVNSANNVIDVLANDVPGPSNESTQSLEVVFAFSINGGDVSVDPDDYTLLYTPPTDFTGEDRIQYLVRDDGTTAGVDNPLASSGEVLVQVGDVDLFA